MSFEAVLKHSGSWDEMKKSMDLTETQLGDLSQITDDPQATLRYNQMLEKVFREQNQDVLWDLHKRLMNCDHRLARFPSHVWREPCIDDAQDWEARTSCENNAMALSLIGGRAVDPNNGEKLAGFSE